MGLAETLARTVDKLANIGEALSPHGRMEQQERRITGEAQEAEGAQAEVRVWDPKEGFTEKVLDLSRASLAMALAQKPEKAAEIFAEAEEEARHDLVIYLRKALWEQQGKLRYVLSQIQDPGVRRELAVCLKISQDTHRAAELLESPEALRAALEPRADRSVRTHTSDIDTRK